MNTATVTRTQAVPRALLVGEWLGEAALSISNWLSDLAAQRGAVREANAPAPIGVGNCTVTAKAP